MDSDTRRDTIYSTSSTTTVFDPVSTLIRSASQNETHSQHKEMVAKFRNLRLILKI